MSEAERAGASRQDRSERLLAGRYRLGGVLGRGGMGTVWRAEDETLGRTVAVKELRFPGSIDEDEKRRLITRTLREAKAIARIRNNSAVTVFDVVEEDDRPWIVMELVEGKSLAEVIREDGLLEPRRAAEVGLAILDVLRSAHREGILHRDVKPSNVLMSEDGRVVLTDFGIAQVEGDPSITSTGMLVGAPSYISPERARGHKPGPAADLWSLGGLLYASVEGVPPYDKGSAIATLTAVMTEQLEEPKNAGPLKDVIYGLLNKDPAKRLDDAGARRMLNAVIHAPEPKPAAPEPMDATKVVPLPVLPGKGKGAGRSAESGSQAESGSGSKRVEEAGERFRGAFRSVKKAAVAASAGAGAAVRTKSAGSAGTAAASEPAGAAGAVAASGSVPSAGVADEAAKTDDAPETGTRTDGTARGTVVPGARDGQARDRGAQGGNAATGGRSSGWPVVPPPDLPPRSVPRAPLTDVVPKRTLVLIAVVVAVIVLGVVLALVLGGDDSTDSSAGGAKNGGDKVTSTSSDSAETKEDKDDGTRTDGGQSADPTTGKETGTGTGTGAGSSPSASVSASGESGRPAGVSTYTAGQGFSIGLPAGWKYQSTGAAGARFAGPDGQRLLVGWTTTPKSDPVADWKNQEQYMTRSQYDRIRIAKVSYRGWNTADWEFTYAEGGTKYRSVDRGFVVDGQLGYGLMFTAKASNWDSELRKETWRTFTETFEPKS
ncbi:serine/threonine-protein kinase [Streptomyces sp. WI04-05B]|uniref:serine/threonine-protein kinase n=1 Tax=Streptomyces TaxID=1883 RepID=UPI0029B44498|nr:MULTISPECIES: serine/threonine-protein kinase [unclassified Streptomyces]MDX2543908.1 serine/threonine-protein kinase [Streptomyces sp. WI04-05B]MDX2584382.1 serine/threonine-protein kinase [Streptomyces sp. WI04-05A]MDX3753058.1 serine/threonine-protein kinase [Streptomyces sp. AK08-02]